MEESNITNNRESTNTESKGFRISEAAILAIAPAVAYFLVYIYEYGYCHAFGIPASFIQIDITTVLGFTLGIVALFFVMTIIIDSALSFFIRDKDNPSPIYKILVARSPILLIAIIFLIVYSFDATGFKIIGFTLLLIFIMDILPALIPRTHHRHLSFAERVDIVIKGHIRQRDSMFTVWDIISNKLGRHAFFIIFYAFWAIIICYYMGRLDASRKKTFLFPSTRQELLVGKIYGSNVLCISVDNTTMTINPGIIILNLSQLKEIELKYRDFGPVRIRK